MQRRRFGDRPFPQSGHADAPSDEADLFRSSLRRKDLSPITTAEPIEIEKRVHSLHPHGFVFAAASDGAYPLSPPDSTQPVSGILVDESFAWSKVPGFSGILKKGDRVPPGGTFTYTWNTLSWPTTAGVWLYHDHSICDTENVESGAIGIIVIHNRVPAGRFTQRRPPRSTLLSPPTTSPGLPLS